MLRLRQDSLPLRGSSHNFVGADQGDVGISVFLFDGEPGRGPGPHRHPYDEIQFVQRGRGRWTVEGVTFEAGPGDIHVIKAGEVHSFTAIGDEPLVQLDVHVSPRFIQENLTETPAAPDGTTAPAAAAPNDPARALLRHAAATLAYRAAKALRDAPASFGDFRAGPATRTPHEIVAHMGDLMEWALGIAQGRAEWRDVPRADWARDVERFFTALGALDAQLAGAAPLGHDVLEKLFQGPVADALTHTGQLALLRRLDGSPIRGESYYGADIAAGRTGLAQSPPQFEFD